MTSLAPLSRPHVYRAADGATAATPTLLLLHGTGADEHDLLSLGTQLNPNANLLSPRGLHLENGMNRFFERYPDGTFNEESIDLAVADLADFVVAATEHYGFAAEAVTAVGFSNGANTAAALLVSRPDLLSGAALFGSTRPYRSRLIEVSLDGKRVWLANGDQDSYAPLDRSLAWVSDLQAAGAQVSLLRHPGGHQISLAHVQQISRELA